MKKILNCITIGDEKGIGLELIYKIWKNHKKNTKTFFLIGNMRDGNICDLNHDDVYVTYKTDR